MKRLILFAFLFSALAVPALGELTDADLNKIRLVVKEEVATAKSDLRTEMATLKEDLRAEITTLKADLKADIATSERHLKTYIDAKVETKIEGIQKQISLLTNVVYALIALIVAAIAIPQLILTWRSSGDRQQQRINQELREEIEALKQQQIARP